MTALCAGSSTGRLVAGSSAERNEGLVTQSIVRNAEDEQISDGNEVVGVALLNEMVLVGHCTVEITFEYVAYSVGDLPDQPDSSPPSVEIGYFAPLLTDTHPLEKLHETQAAPHSSSSSKTYLPSNSQPD